MRYIIKHAPAQEEHGGACVATYSAEIAGSAEQAARAFTEKHADRKIICIKPVTDDGRIFTLYGAGAWTDEENAAHRAALSARYDRARIEHEEARRIVSTYSLEELCREQEYAARRAEEETQNADGVHVGDIFYSCWGYDQTNYDFYQVVALRGKHTAILRENACKAEMCSDYNGYKRPIRDAFRNEKEHSLRTSYDDYYKCPHMKVPELSGQHYMRPIEAGKLYQHSSGA